MGIESDQLVFDYLSRVGDLAQQRQLSSHTRMRLVSGLRNEIDRRRATHGVESPTAVRGILRQLGTPDEVVDRAAGIPPVPELPKELPTELPEQRGRGRGRGRLRKVPKLPKPRTEAGAGAAAGVGAAPPHLAGTDELGSSDVEPDWWRTDANAVPEPGQDLAPGFVGGVEIPELLKPPVEDEDEDAEEPGADEEDADLPRGRWGRLLRARKARKARRKAEAEPEPEAEPEDDADPAADAGSTARLRLANPFLLLAALLLVTGAVFGSLIPLAAGWLLAYASRRLSRAEAKAAVLVIPGLTAAAGIVWIWGRVEGRWGAPVAAGGEAMRAAIGETWPWVLRGAAVASALFLIWRSRRH